MRVSWPPGTRVTFPQDLSRAIRDPKFQSNTEMVWQGYPKRAKTRGLVHITTLKCPTCGGKGGVQESRLDANWLVPIDDIRTEEYAKTQALAWGWTEISQKETSDLWAKYSFASLNWNSPAYTNAQQKYAAEVAGLASIVMAKKYHEEAQALLTLIRTTPLQLKP